LSVRDGRDHQIKPNALAGNTRLAEAGSSRIGAAVSSAMMAFHRLIPPLRCSKSQGSRPAPIHKKRKTRGKPCGFSRVVLAFLCREHRTEKWNPVFGKSDAQTKN